MDAVISVISMLVAYFGTNPSVGKYISLALLLFLSLGSVVTSFVALWKSVVLFLQAISKIPGLSGLANVAASLKVQEDKITDFSNSKIMPILNRLSSISLPKSK